MIYERCDPGLKNYYYIYSELNGEYIDLTEASFTCSDTAAEITAASDEEAGIARFHFR